MKIAILSVPLLVLTGCVSTNWNNALGTPKNPAGVFVDPIEAKHGETAFIIADYRLLLTAIDAEGVTRTDALGAADAQAYLEAGFNLSDAYCDRFLNKTVESAMRRRYGRALTNDIGTGANALLGAFGAGKDIISAFATSFGFADSAWRNYDEAFLIAPELSNVQILVRATQVNVKERALRALPATYTQARTQIRDYARYCTNLGMRALINQSAIEKTKRVEKDAKAGEEEEAGSSGREAPSPVSPAAPSSE